MPSPRAPERSRALAIRSKLELTQEEFARLLGFNFPTVNRWERGGSRPTGLGAVVLALLESTARAHAPSHVVATLRRALEADDALPGRAGRSLTVVRTLVELEFLPPRNHPCGVRAPSRGVPETTTPRRAPVETIRVNYDAREAAIRRAIRRLNDAVGGM